MPQLPQQAADRALAVLEVHRANLMFQPGVMGAGIGAGRTDNEAAIVIYVNKEADFAGRHRRRAGDGDSDGPVHRPLSEMGHRKRRCSW